MAALTRSSCLEHFVQVHRNIIRPKTGLITDSSSTGSPRNPMKGFHSTSSSTSSNSTPSQRSIPARCFSKDQVSHCLGEYQTLAREGLNSNSAKVAVFWCCLGLGVVTYSQNLLTQQTPFSAESGSGSICSLDTVCDSGFAHSFDSERRNRLSVDAPDAESTITNLVGGIAGVFASGLLSSMSASHGLALPEVGQDFAPSLSWLGLAQTREIKNILSLAAEISTELLSILQNDPRMLNSSLSYWALCLKFVTSSSEGDQHTTKMLRSQLIDSNPPHCLAEPARSYIVTTSFQGGVPSFPKLDLLPKLPCVAARFYCRTRSRAASLMSHSSLRSFSSIRSFDGLSAKSPATIFLSPGIHTNEITSTSGSSIIQSSTTALRALSPLDKNLGVYSRQKEALSSENVRSVVIPSPSLWITRSGSISNGSSNGRRKGKEKATQLSREGIRPGTTDLRVRTGTRFVVTSPLAPNGLGNGSRALPKMDPVLAALEKHSKLKSKSKCLNCEIKGDNYPCCSKCGEAWCSRECRVEANSEGKHVCKRASSLG